MASDFPEPLEEFPATLEPVSAETAAAAPAEAAPVEVVAEKKEPAKPAKRPKPPMTIYSWMLVLSLLILTIASVALVVELKRYNFEIRPGFQLIKF